ncbi:MAG: pseudouridine synthase [Terriglobia bacterium]|nr:pseudouridine synthase [Terriglobia bacterium]
MKQARGADESAIAGTADGKIGRGDSKAERLQKILASAGVASRRKAEEFILQGRVQVNGQIVNQLGSKADPVHDHIRVDGKLIHPADEYRYYMLNKPKQFVTTASDPQGRPTVMEFFSRIKLRMFPVGRLDYHSEGLLLVTNDGELANALTRAASHVPKTYLVKVSGVPSEDALNALRRGISIPLGDAESSPGHRGREARVRTAPATVQLFRQGENPWYEITITEGRNRQLRKMFEEIGHHVEKIRRVEYGPLVLDLPPGESRELTAHEVQALYRAAKLSAPGIRSQRIETKSSPRSRSGEHAKALSTSSTDSTKGSTRKLAASRKGREPGTSHQR